MTVEDMFRVATALLSRAGAVGGRRYGVIIVHARELVPGATELAVATTLPDRRYYRALCAEVLAQSALADGYTVETALDAAKRDYKAILGER